MDNFRNATKAFIVDNGKVLFLKRRSTDPHQPGQWDIPGGRLELGEDPYTALHREVLEETGITVDIHLPLGVNYLTRDDGQRIALAIYWCSPHATSIVLSEEHQDYIWVPLGDVERFPQWYRIAREVYLDHRDIEF